MKLSRKIFTIVGLALFISILLIYIFSKSYLLRSFRTIEQNEIEANTQTVLRSIEKDIDNISSLNLDYSIWGETYEFMANHNKYYITSNFADISPFKKLGIDFFMFVDSSGKIVYSRIVDSENKNQYIIQNNDLNYIKSNMINLYKSNNHEIKGILSLHNIPVLISAQPIVENDGSGIPRGLIISGKLFDSDEINYLSKDLNLNIGITPFNFNNNNYGSINGNEFYSEIQNSMFIYGHGLLKDVLGQPAFVVNLKMHRQMYGEALSNINSFIGILISVAIIFNVFILILLDKMVVKKILKMKDIVDKVHDTEDLTQIISLKGNDEITELGDHFNKMFKKLNKTKQDILKIAYYDSLTGLPNRKRLLENLELKIENKKSKFALLYIDLDNFKSINDSLGHDIGDIILEKVAKRFKALENELRLIARVGGDEFIIVQDNIENNTTAQKLALDVSKLLKPVIKVNNREHYLGASIGISIFPDDGNDVATLMKNADVAMYAAKKAGEHSYEFYSRNMNGKSLDILILEASLRKALINNEFIIHYQPVKSISQNAVIGSEALIRWQLNGTLVPPNDFIPIAKLIGEIVNIDNWVLHNACMECKKWNEKSDKSMCVSVNISFKQLKQKSFINEVKAALENAKLEPHFLNLEITEDEAMEDVELTIRTLQQLKDIGIRISLDDFGTGYSSLSYVNMLPINTLKIDRSLITNIDTNCKSLEIVRSTIAMSHSLGIRVIAEGIENIEQFNTLAELNCDCIQGFYVGKPMEAQKFVETFL